MFGFLQPQCPVPRDEKAWLENGFAWLTDQFGRERLQRGTVILPTEQFFPDRFDGTNQTIRLLLDRVCKYMDVDCSTVLLHLYDEGRTIDLGPGCMVVSEGSGTAGTYRQGAKTVVSVEATHREEPVILVAIMAHELGHARLLGENRINAENRDHEKLTDLSTVFFGLGIFNANACIHESQQQVAGWYRWSIGRMGYLSKPMWAYALALYAWARGENKPPWAKHLRTNVRCLMKDGLRYLLKTK